MFGPGVTEAGENEHCAEPGNPLEQLKAMGWLKPFTEDTVTLYVAVWPALIETSGGDAASPKFCVAI